MSVCVLFVKDISVSAHMLGTNLLYILYVTTVLSPAIQEHEVKFTKIAAMTSAFVLVTKSGQLFEWPYESPLSDEPDAMETNGLSFFTNSSSAHPPKAVPHPLSCELGLQDKCVCLLSTSGIRASVLTTSGHICTFYDKLVKGQ